MKERKTGWWPEQDGSVWFFSIFQEWHVTIFLLCHPTCHHARTPSIWLSNWSLFYVQAICNILMHQQPSYGEILATKEGASSKRLIPSQFGIPSHPGLPNPNPIGIGHQLEVWPIQRLADEAMVDQDQVQEEEGASKESKPTSKRSTRTTTSVLLWFIEPNPYMMNLPCKRPWKPSRIQPQHL